MIESMSTTPGVGDGAPGIAPVEAVRAPMAPAMPKAPDAAQLAENAALASAIIPDLTANPPRLDAALADAAGLPVPNTLEPDGKAEPRVKPTEPPKTEDGARIKSFTTDHGSVYTYDSDGKTTRIKTAGDTPEQFEKQGITVFMDLNAEEAQQVLEAVQVKGSPLQSYIVERQADDSAVSIADLESVTNPDNLYLVVYENGKPIVVKKASLTPSIGKSVYDTRKFQGENGETLSERHLGNNVASIETSEAIPTDTSVSEPALIAPEPAGTPTVEDPISDLAAKPEAPAEPAAPTEGEVDEELVSEIIAAAEKAKEEPPLFSLIAPAKANLDELTAGKASDERIYKAQLALEDAINNEAGLTISAALVQARDSVNAGRETPQALAEAGQALKDLVAERDKTYKGIFTRAKARAKKTKTEYKDVLRSMAEGAKEVRDEAKAEYRKLQENGSAPEALENARLKYEAARLHHATINREKRKRALLEFLKIALISSFITTTNQTGKTIKEGTLEGTTSRR